MNLVQLEVMALGGSCGRKSEVGRMSQISQAPLSDEQTEAHQALFHSSFGCAVLASLTSETLDPTARDP